MKKSEDKDYYWNNANSLGWGPKVKMPDYKIRELLELVAGPKVLDVGCGPGHWVNVLALYGFEAYGIDAERRFVDLAQSEYQGKFMVAKAEKLPFKDKEFDTVFVRSVLEHLENDGRALSEALRVGRKVVVIVPKEVPDNLRKRGLVFSHYMDKTHLRTYTQSSLKKLVDSAGGELLELRNIERLPVKSIFFELTRGWSIFKRLAIKIWFSVFREEDIYLELLAIIKPC